MKVSMLDLTQDTIIFKSRWDTVTYRDIIGHTACPPIQKSIRVNLKN